MLRAVGLLDSQFLLEGVVFRHLDATGDLGSLHLLGLIIGARRTFCSTTSCGYFVFWSAEYSFSNWTSVTPDKSHHFLFAGTTLISNGFSIETSQRNRKFSFIICLFWPIFIYINFLVVMPFIQSMVYYYYYSVQTPTLQTDEVHIQLHLARK